MTEHIVRDEVENHSATPAQAPIDPIPRKLRRYPPESSQRKTVADQKSPEDKELPRMRNVPGRFFYLLRDDAVERIEFGRIGLAALIPRIGNIVSR